MSYTEYLRRKDAAMIKVKDTRENTDASMHTVKIRMAAAQDFASSGGRVGVVNTPGDMSMSPLHQVNSYQKVSGGRTPDASSFTTYRGGQAIGAATQAGLKPNQVQVGIGSCYVITPTTPALNSSDWIRDRLGCQQANGQAHEPGTVGPALFVDNTIRNQGDPGLCTARAANHTAPADVPHNLNIVRPILADKGNLAPGKEVGALGGNPNYKPGAALRRPQNYQISKKDSNTGTTSFKPVPTNYQIPANSPAHLKINDAMTHTSA